ncbi:MAG: restriction endonuclease subunit S, partial [Muribaculaceae bacterium]|nr:restriction endonuclease subunit S [Muribaculaceae bacterium]
MQPVISNKGLENIDIILPPLSLQEEFADKIEAIETQKELLKRSIKEVETLFDARMDYYFGDT